MREWGVIFFFVCILLSRGRECVFFSDFSEKNIENGENKKVKREKNKWKEYSSSKVVSCLETPPEC